MAILSIGCVYEAGATQLVPFVGTISALQSSRLVKKMVVRILGISGFVYYVGPGVV